MNATLARRPQLSPEELQQLKLLLGALLTLVAVSTVFYMDVDAWILTALTALATVATVVRPALPARVPPLAHTLAFPAIVAFFAADLWLKAEVLPAMVRLDILLLLYRNISYRQRRDDLQIIVLGLFLIVVAGVLSVSLTFAVHILVYTACALALLLVLTLSEGTGPPAARRPATPGAVPLWAQHAHWGTLVRRLRAVTDWRVLGLGAVLFAGVVAVSALLFLAIPRFQLENSMFLDRFISKKAKSGFSDTIRIGEVTDILQDNGLALSIDVADPSQIPPSPYWRMLVLDSYDNGTFRFSAALRQLEMEPGERTSPSLYGQIRPRRGELGQWTFFLESGVSRYLPLLGRFHRLQFREPQRLRFAPQLATVALAQEPVTMTAYRVDGFDLAPNLVDVALATERKRPEGQARPRVGLYLQLPAFGRDTDSATLNRILAEASAAGRPAAPVFAERVNAWLRQNHTYSLSPRIPSGSGDPLVRWVNSREAGHCELFAGSFVLLARAAGYPARVVTGFRGGSWNGYSNSFTIRNADAHAWAEIFDDATGAWLRADPLAAPVNEQTGDGRAEGAVGGRRDRSWTARLESLRVFWYRRIVSFDQRSQAETLKAVKEATQNSGKRVREAVANGWSAVRTWFTTPWDARRAGATAGVAVALAGLVWLWRAKGRAWWRRLTQRRGGPGDDPVRREAGRWLQRLPRDPASGSGAGIRTELQRLRFGPRATWPAEPAKVFRRARQASREGRRRGDLTPS